MPLSLLAMARARDFPLLFLLPLILGCFLSTSRAETHPPKHHKGFESDEFPTKSVFREAPQWLPFAYEDPKTGAHYRNLKEMSYYPATFSPFKKNFRGLQEREGFAEEEAEDNYGYREAHTDLGYRKTVTGEIKDVIDAFEKKYLTVSQCEKVKDKISSLLGLLRVALNFVN